MIDLCTSATPNGWKVKVPEPPPQPDDAQIEKNLVESAQSMLQR